MIKFYNPLDSEFHPAALSIHHICFWDLWHILKVYGSSAVGIERAAIMSKLSCIHLIKLTFYDE